jgi:hypothetical protein
MILWLLPIGAVTAFIGFSPIGLILIGAAGFFFIISLYLWGEIVGLKICQSAAEVISEDPEELTTSSHVILSHWADILLYALILPRLSLTYSLNRTSDQNQQSQWVGRPLTLPIISLENLSLRETLERVKQITRDNLLRFKPGLVPVGLVVKGLQGTLMICGVVLGTLLAKRISAISTTSHLWLRLLGTSSGMAVAWLLTMIGVLFSTTAQSCYHTALYLWTRNVEDAYKNHNAQKAAPPKILQHVLGSSGISKKERKNGPKKRDPHLE